MHIGVALIGLVALPACSGAMVASAMPGEMVTVNGNTFTVADTANGLTIRNFETGRTPPATLLANAGLAAEQVTGCPVSSIIKDGPTNTYFASTSCPDA